MGCLFRIKATVVKDFSSFIKAARGCGRRVFAAELTESALPLGSVELNKRDVFVIGNEGHGIPVDISSECDKSVFIPITQTTATTNSSMTVVDNAINITEDGVYLVSYFTQSADQGPFVVSLYENGVALTNENIRFGDSGGASKTILLSLNNGDTLALYNTSETDLTVTNASLTALKLSE
jgi:hypothetical protein